MSKLPQRKSPRLKDYDYSQEGAYFVTICVQGRLPLFGQIDDEKMVCSPAGDMIGYWWHELSNKFNDIKLDYWVVMPNHFHGIIYINRYDSESSNTSLPDTMKWFKTMSTNAYVRGVNMDNWQPFQSKLWQRSYHDHIIRNENDLNRIREYVLNNPARWEADVFYE